MSLFNSFGSGIINGRLRPSYFRVAGVDRGDHRRILSVFSQQSTTAASHTDSPDSHSCYKLYFVTHTIVSMKQNGIIISCQHPNTTIRRCKGKVIRHPASLTTVFNLSKVSFRVIKTVPFGMSLLV